MPHLKKAELIEGEVYVGSPVRHTLHGQPQSQLVAWLTVYAAATPGVESGDNSSVRLDLDNEPQPDSYLLVIPERGGQTKFNDGYIEGAPELVAEIATSSVSYDLGKKRDVYRRSGVREYIVWRVLDRAIDWFLLRDGVYELQSPGADGVLRSAVFLGLWLDPEALLRGDLETVLTVLKQGIGSAEHTAFMERLNNA
jgi:Uma2 family endonuclease